ncbi:MAG: hypothetical protein NTZ39_02365 [Methanoregula sp.]|nr:hypothetical protein [Methanoregula sp.]
METESTNLKDVAEPDPVVSTTAGTGQKQGNEREPEKNTRHTAPRLVERKTELRGQAIAPSWKAPALIRKRTEQDLKESNAEIPYYKAEKANRDLFCSLIERQDRMIEELFLVITDLKYRMEDIEEGRR